MIVVGLLSGESVLHKRTMLARPKYAPYASSLSVQVTLFASYKENIRSCLSSPPDIALLITYVCLSMI